MAYTKCPSCGGEHIEKFFQIKNAPIFSTAIFKSKDAALEVPRKDIELNFCNNCGFIFNRLFNVTNDYFKRNYEDQQGFSETFMRFLTGISQKLVKKYNLKGKTIVEIGCGKGDFLNLLVGLNMGKGFGIDPAYVEGRQTNPNLTFYKEFYSLKHGKIPADLICCRHTLEHIFNTADFLILIKNSLEKKTDPIIFFEVPQIKKILENEAFWDIYYEHCSYFSPGSIARIFRKTGYEIIDLRLDYNDQYLLIEAKPSLKKSGKNFAIEESIEELKALTTYFNVKVSEKLARWRSKLVDLKLKNRKTVIWGGGSKAVGFLTHFADLDLIDYIVDINPHMEGNFSPGTGKRYVQPEFLKNYRPDTLIIMNEVYVDEITKSLHDIELYPEICIL